MIRTTTATLVALALALPLAAQEAPAPVALAPGEIVAAAAPQDWIRIAPEDLVVMTLAPAADGSAREVVIQLMPPPFSQGWVANIRTLARAGWYDGISINRVQDNYVVQWGDATEKKPLPEGLAVVFESGYIHSGSLPNELAFKDVLLPKPDLMHFETFHNGFPIAGQGGPDWVRNWPVHCYGMVGVGRGYSPDTGSGAELYTVIGHAPRHLDRNIALVGRVIDGMEHLSSLPRGTGALGFYEDPSQRVPIQSIRVANDLPAAEQPRFEYLSTESDSFARYAEARANRRDPFFIVPAGGADICNIPVPVRRSSIE